MAEGVKLADVEALRQQLLGRLDEQGERFWYSGVAECMGQHAPHQLHLAIFREPFLSLLLEGRKTVESRFSVNRIAPYECARADDVVLIKESSGPIVGLALLDHPGFYELDEESWAQIPREFGERICATDDDFWEERRHTRYVSILPVRAVVTLDSPLAIRKADRRGWVLLPTGNACVPGSARRAACA
jgi:hypothetical protein